MVDLSPRTILVDVDLVPHFFEFGGIELSFAAEKLLEDEAHLILVDAIVLVLVKRIPHLANRVDLDMCVLRTTTTRTVRKRHRLKKK